METFPADASAIASLANRQQQGTKQLENSEVQEFDRAMMRRCIELARRALGKTAPNPLVGSVIVRDGKIVGEGFHPGAGQPHAEVFALREAGELAEGATVYVNLEPCNHYGRTPPCSEALVKAKVAKVVAGMVDPNPLVAGTGLARLREAGIEVVAGVEGEACQKLNEAFVHRILYRRPFGILKYAMTLDGKIATTTGHSAWVTGKEARSEVHRVRVGCDAVIVGGNTVRLDNPLLTSHKPDRNNPLRVVMSRTLDLPKSAWLWETSVAATLVLTEPGVNPEFQEFLIAKGVEVVELSPLTPTNIMAYIAPKIVGGKGAPTPVGDLGFSVMTDALTLERVSWRAVGADCVVEGYLKIK